MRAIWSILFSLLAAGWLAGCGGRDIEIPEKPAPPPQEDPETTSAPVPPGP